MPAVLTPLSRKVMKLFKCALFMNYNSLKIVDKILHQCTSKLRCTNLLQDAEGNSSLIHMESTKTHTDRSRLTKISRLSSYRLSLDKKKDIRQQNSYKYILSFTALGKAAALAALARANFTCPRAAQSLTARYLFAQSPRGRARACFLLYATSRASRLHRALLFVHEHHTSCTRIDACSKKRSRC